MSTGILLSGGIDSIALAYLKRPKYAFTINYGQIPAEAEFLASAAICNELNIIHHRINIDCSSLGSGDLLDQDSIEDSPSSEWWPYRNQLLVTLAVMKAISLGVKELMVGSVKSDGFHKDGTEKFYQLLNDLSSYQEGGVSITSPAIHYTSAELVRASNVPDNLLLWAHSCHKSNSPCGNCRGCNKYLQVMYEIKGGAYESYT
ncbi:7-cyano-7-deazaguanine synthase [Sphingobacterium daejeonense]|uniref:7-cyano-7-deazaguanine synthase n=1 Tax=Sphingobacterium daejeonense TaxID=371142 RepID=UPI0010C41BFE|nr:7-cyano-7-deazaguanine synthase [Sphingobacterium daejeonense]VTP87306.1 Asparagine synthase (glutamine-hydrolyzing) [Sphingobacterium daejeonense]